MDTWISFIRITLALATGLFGALGLLTKYRDDSGKITKWGRVALGGILLSSSFSVILYALEASKSKAAAEKAKAEANATAQLLQNILANAQTTADQQKRTLDETNVLKLGLEETLKEQRYISKGMESSLATQQSVLTGNERILGGVSKTIAGTTTTLRATQRLLQPLGQMEVWFELGISMSPNTSGYLQGLREEFKRVQVLFSKTGEQNQKNGIHVLPDFERSSKNEYKAASLWFGSDSPLQPRDGSKASFLKAVPFYISFYSARVTPSLWERTHNGPTPDLRLHVHATAYDWGPNAADMGLDRGKNLNIEYNVATDSFSLGGINIKAYIQSDNGTIRSVIDLPGLTMVVEFLRHEELSLQSMHIQVATGKAIRIKPGTLKMHVIHGRELYFYEIRPEDVDSGS